MKTQLRTTSILLLLIFCMLITSCEDDPLPSLIPPPSLPPDPPFDWGPVIWILLLLAVCIAACCIVSHRAAIKRDKMLKQAVLNSEWWNISDNHVLLIDTCVLMNEYTELDKWMKWIATQAADKSWEIHIIKEVYNEIKRLKASGSPAQQHGARMAIRRVEMMQIIAGVHMSVGCETKISSTLYADDPLRGYVCNNARSILFTGDKDLGIRVRAARCSEQLRMIEEFKPYPGNM